MEPRSSCRNNCPVCLIQIGGAIGSIKVCQSCNTQLRRFDTGHWGRYDQDSKAPRPTIVAFIPTRK